MIADRNLQPGDRLPTEAQMGEQFGVSRTMIREAVKLLEAVGLVTARRGSGHYVNQRPSATMSQIINYSLALDPDALFSLFEFRRLLEVDAVGLAAERITPRSLALLEEALAENETAAQLDDVVRFYSSDRLIHQRIAEATNNTYLLSTVQAVDSLVGASSRAAAGIKGSRTIAKEQHKAIVVAIRKGDVTKAKHAMEEHINTFIQNYRRLLATHVLPDDAAEAAG
jgi:DNA-binding FadR family transcriptional regulator